MTIAQRVQKTIHDRIWEHAHRDVHLLTYHNSAINVEDRIWENLQFITNEVTQAVEYPVFGVIEERIDAIRRPNKS